MDSLNAEITAFSLQLKGDQSYHEQSFASAFMNYTNSIELSKKMKSYNAKKLKNLYAKRGLTLLKMNEYKKCLEDLQCALKMQKKYESDKELLKLKNSIVVNCLKTDPNLSTILEDEELENIKVDFSPEVLFNVNEDSIMNMNKEDSDDSLNDEDDDPGNESATLEDLLDEFDLSWQQNEEISIEKVIEKISMIESDDDDDGSSDSDSTLTDNTLKDDDDKNDSNFISEEEEL